MLIFDENLAFHLSFLHKKKAEAFLMLRLFYYSLFL